MNAVTRTPSQPTTPLSVEDSHRLAVSALVDGELSAAELDGLLRSKDAPAGWDADWNTFHLIGDVLRGSEPVLPSRLTPDFASQVTQRLRVEAVSRPAMTEAPLPVRGAAANDAVFRWKLVAGLASLAAVAAVGWALVGTAAPTGAGPQLALVGSPTVQVASQEAPQAVVVQTPQGQVLRDARLEQLLAEHRQYGGMSALQMPAGFLRNATYDAAPR